MRTTDRPVPCAHMPAVFDEPRGDVARLASLCGGCPVVVDCLREALADPSSSGFRAGTTESDRWRLRRRLGLARRACRGCGEPVLAQRVQFCSRTCRDLARARRRAAFDGRRESRRRVAA
jgi:hypothetical protein